MSTQYETVGIMFTNAMDEDGNPFPRVRDLSGGYSYAPWGTSADGFEDWYVLAWNPRNLTYHEEDAEAMDETNWDAVLEGLCAECEDLAPADLPHLYEDSHYSGSQGWLTSRDEDEAARARLHGLALLKCHGADTLIARPDWPGLTEAAEFSRALSDYPLLDEEAYSERECEAWNEYAPQAWHDELIEAARDETLPEAVLEALEDTEASEILWPLCSGLHYENGLTGEYGPPLLEILRDRLTEHYARADMEPLPVEGLEAPRDWRKHERDALKAALPDVVLSYYAALKEGSAS